MKEHTQQRKICDSWYHQKWFRILLIIVAVDMIFLGVSFAIGLDIIGLIQGMGTVWRVIGGLAYISVALFIIHYAMSYGRLQKETYFVCQHCAHTKEGK
jgi:DMSO/TMAO reductase YedYZ heme-binding membrane subunit